jgi:3-hydroxyanthranilate 3,4-dioxygenase
VFIVAPVRTVAHPRQDLAARARDPAHAHGASVPASPTVTRAAADPSQSRFRAPISGRERYACAVQPIDLRRWLDEHQDALRPPVGNARLFPDGDFVVMAVAGPNARKDFHVDPGDELFWQLEGDLVLRVREDETVREIVVPEGAMLLLPAEVPHSPQRAAGTVGLVVERRRRPGEIDRLQWPCDRCGALVHEEAFELVDIGAQIADAIARVRADVAARTCGSCGAVLEL